MLSTLAFAATAVYGATELQELADVLGKLEAAPENEFTTDLGKYQTCPGARYAFANIHTMAQMAVTFTNSCDEVAAEIDARAQMSDGFVDPHNGGTYTLLGTNNGLITTKRLTGNRRFTDKQTFSMEASGTGCRVIMCSESQGTSANDGGTNLCDMFDLYCNSGEKNPQTGVACKPIKTDLQYTIDSEQCGRYVFQNQYAGHTCQNKQTTCLKISSKDHAEAMQALVEQPPKCEIPKQLGQYRTCPGNNAYANIHTMAQMQVSFSNSCDEVAAEVQARASMQNGWHDPHNGGRYWVVSAQSNLIETGRRTGNNKYTDKQTFSLEANGSGCTAYICSESQGTSANDGGTNLCDMFDLFCNSSETNPQTGVSCKPIKTDLKYNIVKEVCGRYVYENDFRQHQCQARNPTCLKTNGGQQDAAPAPKKRIITLA